MPRPSPLCALTLATFCFAASVCAQSGVANGGATPGFSDPRLALEMLKGEATVNIHVTDSTGRALDVQADVKLLPVNPTGDNRVFTNAVAGSQFVATVKRGLAHIENVMGGDYFLEISAPGYQFHREKLTVIGGYGKTEAFVKLHGFDGSEDDVEFGQPGAPEINPSAQREVELTVAALQAGKKSDAAQHIRSALKRSPNSPDVHYLAGYVAELDSNSASARAEYEAAIKIFPKHLASQNALGNLLLRAGDASGAIPHFERALDVGPNSWRAHWLLAEALLQLDPPELDKSRENANRALALGDDKAAAALVTLAIADGVAGDLEEAKAKLHLFLQHSPNDPSAHRARQILQAVEKAESESAARIEIVPHPVNDALDLEGVSPDAIPGLPSNIDAAVPQVTPGAACMLPQVLVGAAVRSNELVDNIQRFSARELVVHEELDSKGTARNSAERTYDYVAAIERPTQNLIAMREMRDGVFGFGPQFPAPLAMDGIPAIGLIFNPVYSGDFTFTCEGLGHWRGQPAWQLRFEQKPNTRPRIHQWRVNNFVYPAHLKGRAWLTADSYQLLHVETDLAQPILAIRLEYQHISIDYAPVPYPSKQSALWLPKSAQINYKYKGHFFRQEHSLSDFTLFSIDTKEKIADPRQKGEDPK